MSRLIVDVSQEQHKLIKALAATEGKSIKDYVLERVLPTTDTADTDEAWEALKALLAERIAKAESGALSARSLSDITDATLKSLR